MKQQPGFVPSLPLRGSSNKAKISTKPPTLVLGPKSVDDTYTKTKVEMAKNNNQRSRSRTKTGTVKPDGTYVPAPLSSSSSISGEDFSNIVKRSPFFDESKGDPVFFRADVEPVYFTQNYDDVKHNEEIINPRMSVNLARYHDPAAFTATLPDTKVIEHYKTIYRRQGRDIRSKIKSAALYNQWTFANWYYMINATIAALEIFYTLDSILSYKGDVAKKTKNQALMDIRKQLELNSELMYKKDVLRKRLEGAWFPKSFTQLIQWTYQNYRVSDLPQSEVIRFYPNAGILKVIASDDPAAGCLSNLNVILGYLDEDKVVALWSMLADVYPEHMIIGLPLSSNDSHYDKYFTEIFCNQPVAFHTGTAVNIFPNAAGVTANAGYFTYGSISDPTTDKTCGLPFVLQTVYFSAAGNPYVDFLKIFTPSYSGDNKYYNTNKFCTIKTGGVYYVDARIRENAVRFNTIPDVHFMKQDITSGVVKWKFSSVRAPFQPVYFEIKESPLISMRDFMSTLFEQD